MTVKPIPTRFFSIESGKTSARVPAQGPYIRYGYSIAPKPICTVVVHMGKSEWIEKYSELAKDFRALGINLVAHEWLGQAESYRWLDPQKHGNKTDSPSDEIVVNGSRSFEGSAAFQKLNADPASGKQLPIFYLCHSKGSELKMLDVALKGGSDERIILLSPLLGLIALRPRWLWHQVAESLLQTGEGENFGYFQTSHNTVTEPFRGNLNTSDRRRFTSARKKLRSHPGRRTGGATVRWVYNTFRSIARIEEAGLKAQAEGKKLFPNAIMVGGSRDMIVCGWRPFSRLLGIPLTVLRGARHELLMERDQIRNQALKIITDFIFRELPHMRSPARHAARAPIALAAE